VPALLIYKCSSPPLSTRRIPLLLQAPELPQEPGCCHEFFCFQCEFRGAQDLPKVERPSPK
jgi:hypothetical protein